MDLNMKKKYWIKFMALHFSCHGKRCTKCGFTFALNSFIQQLFNNVVTQKKKKKLEGFIGEIPFLFLNTTKPLLLFCHHTVIFLEVKVK